MAIFWEIVGDKGIISRAVVVSVVYTIKDQKRKKHLNRICYNLHVK